MIAKLIILPTEKSLFFCHLYLFYKTPKIFLEIIIAKKNNKSGVIEALKKAGKWTFDVATKIGASIVAKLIAAACGF